MRVCPPASRFWLIAGFAALLIGDVTSAHAFDLSGYKSNLEATKAELATKTLLVVDLILQAESVVLECVTGLNALLGRLVLIGVLLGFLDHAVNLFLSETTLVVGDGDRLRLSSSLIVRGNL